MPTVRRILKHAKVETARKRRICHRNRKDHAIAKGEPCLVVKDDGGLGSKNYCVACASEILAQACADLDGLHATLGLSAPSRPEPRG